jgi:hypothetical protein
VVIGIPADQIDRWWDDALPMIEKALKRGLGEWAASDIRTALLSRDMQMWGAFDGTLQAVMVTQILTYPQMKVCDLVLCGGRGLKFWKDNISDVEAWAAQQGCRMARLFGRRGWIKALNWQEAYTVIYKEL